MQFVEFIQLIVFELSFLNLPKTCLWHFLNPLDYCICFCSVAAICLAPGSDIELGNFHLVRIDNFLIGFSIQQMGRILGQKLNFHLEQLAEIKA